ncbi:hypothetical protein DERF_002710, partial [Dermatophagoides farinae]
HFYITKHQHLPTYVKSEELKLTSGKKYYYNSVYRKESRKKESSSSTNNNNQVSTMKNSPSDNDKTH